KATRLLRDVLPGLRAAGYQQAIVFTQYTDTMDFLRGCLQNTDLRVLCYSGRGGERLGLDKLWHPCSRDDVKREFRKGAADVLLCTDAAAEGLNFQFCGALINYDMPWNPMRVEQRIGRIDRLGQRHPVIRIVNLHYEDTIETDVYRALRERIGLFSRFVGKLQPILSSLPRGIQGAALAKPGERDRQRADLVSRLEGDIRTAEDAGFDLDAITEGDLIEPERPAAPYGLHELDLILHRPDILPPGIEVKPLGPKEYAYRAPGMAKPVRVTTDPDYFDDQPGSLELWSPGSPLFPDAGELAGGEIAIPGRLASLLKAR
ncbi:MAG: helicase, partial [Propionibacteriaceae bacterium]|nr:helicase [Propionibacteriaceae bacterium]